MTIFVIMFIVTLFQGILPFISKAVIDVGIKTFDLNFINMVLIGNICILLSITIFNVIRDWLLLHITSRVNIALISDYLIKLMKLPGYIFLKINCWEIYFKEPVTTNVSVILS